MAKLPTYRAIITDDDDSGIKAISLELENGETIPIISTDDDYSRGFSVSFDLENGKTIPIIEAKKIKNKTKKKKL